MTDNPIKKPPLGLTPKYIWDEQRFDEIRKAIERYMDDLYPVPLEWIEEYNALAERMTDDTI